MTKSEYDKAYRATHKRSNSSDLPVRLKMGTLRCDCGNRAIDVDAGSGRCERCRNLELRNERIRTENYARAQWRARWSRWFNEPVLCYARSKEVAHE